MKFSMNDSIGKKLFAISGIRILGIIFLVVAGLISLRVAHLMVVLARSERDQVVQQNAAGAQGLASSIAIFMTA